MGNITYAMIKPDAMIARNQGKIIDRILEAGFEIVAMRTMHMTQKQAQTFYDIHRERPFFDELTTFISSGPIIPMVLKKANAVEDFRKFIGATNPADAETGTIRKDFGTNVGENAIHGSDSDENAEKEVAFFFATGDILGNF